MNVSGLFFMESGQAIVQSPPLTVIMQMHEKEYL